MPAGALDGKTALVTGASRGIGEAVALALAREGARVILVARTEAALKEVAAKVDALGVESSVMPLDVTDREAVEASVGEWLETAGPIDVLVNDAGTNRRRKAEEIPLLEWDEILDLNLTAPFHLSCLVMPAMREAKWGRIVNVSSVAGLVALPTGVAYAASKAGLLAMTRNLAREWGPFGITVNAVAPWYVRTDLTEPVLSDPAYLERVLAATPTRRLGTPSDVASAIAFLCSPSASWINGVSLPLDGGFSSSAL